jgi:prolyl 4-hydroxylase
MSEFQPIRITPPIKLIEDVLTDEECNFLISEAKKNLVPGKVVGPSGDAEIYLDHRNCTSSYMNQDNISNLAIQDKISNIIGIDRSHFEGITVIRYLPGEDFKRHPDYFAGPGAAKQSEKGGNRIATVIMYLNDVEDGGDTDFPWLKVWITPKKGNILFFDYSDPDPFIKRLTEHVGKPVVKGEKWIATIWVREFPRTVKFLDHTTFVDIGPIIYPSFDDTIFELEVGPPNDRRMMNVSLPANMSPENTIVIGFTGGMDSALLLYILGALNSQQTIPYFIKPVIITSDNGSSTGLSIADRHDEACVVLDCIRSKVNGNILNLTHYAAPPHLHPGQQVGPGLGNFYNDHGDDRKYVNNMFLYSAINELPGDDTPVPGGPPRPSVSSTSHVKLPFANLKKYHIIDALIQLDLEDVFKYTPKCKTDHKTLLETEGCDNWHCSERRWGFTMINREDLGHKYFIKKDY